MSKSKQCIFNILLTHCVLTLVLLRNIPAIYKHPEKGEQVALVFPIWADNFPPAVRAFVQAVGRENIIAIPTSLGSTLKDRAGFQKVIDLVGKEIAAPDKL